MGSSPGQQPDNLIAAFAVEPRPDPPSKRHLSQTIAATTFEIDQLRGDLGATTYLLNEVTAERDNLRRKLNQIVGELASVRAIAYSEPR